MKAPKERDQLHGFAQYEKATCLSGNPPVYVTRANVLGFFFFEKPIGTSGPTPIASF
jgi:hypothetical protein